MLEERISKEIISEDASIWFSEQYNEFCILIKVPTNTCKSLLKGAKSELILGIDNTLSKPIIHTGIRIFDDLKHPLVLSGSHRFKDENYSLLKILEKGNCITYLYNELGIQVSTGKLKIQSNVDEILHLIANTYTFYSGDFTNEVTRSLDAFDYTVDELRSFENPYKIDIFNLKCSLDSWISTNAHFIGLNESSKTIIDDLDEGGTLEKHVWFSIESLFPFNIHLNPKFKTPKVEKELTDIFAHYNLGLFLIETKGLSIFSQSDNKSMEKKVKTLQKHINKAISQLEGAVRNIEMGTSFYDSKGNDINFKRKIVPHCIILVSELYHFGDWKETQLKILTAMEKSKVFFNVMDFREFMILVKNSKGKKEYLDYYLMNRTEEFVKQNTIHLRTSIKSN